LGLPETSVIVYKMSRSFEWLYALSTMSEKNHQQFICRTTYITEMISVKGKHVLSRMSVMVKYLQITITDILYK